MLNGILDLETSVEITMLDFPLCCYLLLRYHISDFFIHCPELRRPCIDFISSFYNVFQYAFHR